MILRGGGIPNLEVLQNEVYNILNGRGDQIHAFLGKLDTFTTRLNEQREDITEPSIPPTDCSRTWAPARTCWIESSPNSRR